MKKTKKIVLSLVSLLLSAMLLTGCMTSYLISKVFSGETWEESASTLETEKQADADTTETEPDTEPEPGTKEPETEPYKEEPEEIAAFHEYADRLLAELLGDSFLAVHYRLRYPEKIGITLSDPDWDHIDTSEEANAEYSEMLAAYLDELKDFRYEALDKEGRITYDEIKFYLETELESEGLVLYQEPFSPHDGTLANVPLELAEFDFYTESDVEDYLELIRRVPAYFENLLAFEKEKADAGLFMEDVLLDALIEQIETFLAGKDDSFLISTFEERLDALSLTDEEKADYMAENLDLITNVFYPAYEKILAELPSFRGRNEIKGGLSNYPDGDRYYAYILRTKLGSSMSPAELLELVDRSLKEKITYLQLMYLSDPSVYDALDKPVYDGYSPEEMLKILKEKCKEDFPEIGDVDYAVQYVDESLRDFLSPACYMIPPVDAAVQNKILVNCDVDELPEDLFVTLAHEGYPGHLYQNNYTQENLTYYIRDVLTPLGYTEGYAKYTEHNAYRYVETLTENEAEFLIVNAELIMLLHIRVDLGIHYEGWGIEEIADYLSLYTYDPEEAAKELYEYMLSEPGAYAPYAIGEVLILNIENEARDADDFDLVEFRRKLLDAAGAPFDTLANYILGE